jgi:hypothetical protein
MGINIIGGTIVVPHFRAYEFGSLEEEVQNNIFPSNKTSCLWQTIAIFLKRTKLLIA